MARSHILPSSRQSAARRRQSRTAATASQKMQAPESQVRRACQQSLPDSSAYPVREGQTTSRAQCAVPLLHMMRNGMRCMFFPLTITFSVFFSFGSRIHCRTSRNLLVLVPLVITFICFFFFCFPFFLFGAVSPIYV